MGIGDYFNISESNVMNLENILRDPRYADTVFVLIHGGYPLEREAIWLASVKNVYMDSSLMEVVMYPAAFKDSLRQWLETFPDKITFGTDSFPYNDALGAEESYWLGVQTGRTRLGRRFSRNGCDSARSAKPRPSKWRTPTCTTQPSAYTRERFTDAKDEEESDPEREQPPRRF